MKLFLESPVDELTRAERRALIERDPVGPSDVAGPVRDIIERVRARGDRALTALARELDGVELRSIEVPLDRCREAAAALPTELAGALALARDNIRTFHEAQRERLDTLVVETEPGVRLEWRRTALASAGVYAPGGRAAYPSSVLMGVVPAVVAGVPTVAVCSPAQGNGLPDESVMAAAALCGATRVFAVGGAGAVAAMAFGTPTVPPVQALVGPGNAWVTEAKRQVSGVVRIDSPAGPSELLVIADDTADPTLIAVELVAQAEHDPSAVVGLVTSSSRLVARTRSALSGAAGSAERSDIVVESLEQRGFLLHAASMDDAVSFANEMAVEHVAVMTANPGTVADRLTSAGTVFVGPSSSVTYGDYVTGANHVLPTGGASHRYSGLSVEHFLRSFTIQTVSPAAASRLAAPTAVLARAEGLPGHAAAALARGDR